MGNQRLVSSPLPPMRSNPGKPWYLRLAHSWQLWVIIAPSLIYLAIFRYFPMYGTVLAFKDYDPYTGILNSPWVGLMHFTAFFNSYEFQRVLENTVLLSVLYLVIGFPFPIVLALMLNSADNRTLKKSVQMTSFIPYFISTVVMVTIIIELLHPRSGLITLILNGLGLDLKNPMGDPKAFKTIYIVSGIWQNVGYNAIIFIAALASVDPNLYEAAIIDGATKIQRIRYIDFPVIIPTAVILFILSAGRIMNVAFEKIYLMQNNLNLRTSEVISTYVYKVGLIAANFSFGTAVGLFNSLINLLLLIIMNQIMRKYSETSLW
jgi:putative aldouronate transport system permease protein